jgi:carbonic anhydrase
MSLMPLSKRTLPWGAVWLVAGALWPAPAPAGEAHHEAAAPAAEPARREPAAAAPRGEPVAPSPRGEPVPARRIDALRDDESARPVARRPAALRKPAADAEPAVDPLLAIGDRIAERVRQRAQSPSGEIVVRVAARSTAPAPAPGHATAARAVEERRAKAAPAAAVPGHDHWDYQGDNGPAAWAQLKPEFAQCAKGSRQSPIDIRGGIKVELEPVRFDYRPAPFRVIDNGHTVQVAVGAGSFIEVMGRRFELLQFHFHRPSEERIDGKQFDMVVHLVHKDLEGRLAVVAVLLERGSALPLVQNVWNNLPLEKGDEVAVRTPLDPAGLLPVDRSYFTYMGSLTTPPCSEGVLWMVMKNPVPISPDQIGIFARLYPMNARPLQAASGRLIKESN